MNMKILQNETAILLFLSCSKISSAIDKQLLEFVTRIVKQQSNYLIRHNYRGHDFHTGSVVWNNHVRKNMVSDIQVCEK